MTGYNDFVNYNAAINYNGGIQLGGGKNSKPYHVQKQEWEDAERKKLQLEKLAQHEERLEAQAKTLEQRRRNRLDDKALQTQIVLVLKEIHELQNVREKLLKEFNAFLDDEEAILVLMLNNTVDMYN